MRQTFAEQILLKATNDSSILLITGDLGYGVLDNFAQKLPKQFINSGIAEQSMMSMAAGLASQGYQPFVYSIGNFPTFRCLEQIRNDVCYMNNPVTIVSVGAGMGYGNLGYSHHSIEDIGIMRVLPNIQIYSPGDTAEVELSLDLILNDRRPSYLRLGKGGEPLLNSKHISSDSKLHEVKNGNDGIIAFTGSIGNSVLGAAEILKEINLKPRLISVPVLSNESITELVHISQNKVLLTVEEHSIKSGFGSWVLEMANEHSISFPIARIGINPDKISVLGSHQYLKKIHGLSADEISKKFEKHFSVGLGSRN